MRRGGDKIKNYPIESVPEIEDHQIELHTGRGLNWIKMRKVNLFNEWNDLCIDFEKVLSVCRPEKKTWGPVMNFPSIPQNFTHKKLWNPFFRTNGAVNKRWFAFNLTLWYHEQTPRFSKIVIFCSICNQDCREAESESWTSFEAGGGN